MDTPTLKAASYGMQTVAGSTKKVVAKVVKRLLEAGADPNAKDS
jgi:hypothetical protein